MTTKAIAGSIVPLNGRYRGLRHTAAIERTATDPFAISGRWSTDCNRPGAARRCFGKAACHFEGSWRSRHRYFGRSRPTHTRHRGHRFTAATTRCQAPGWTI